MAVVRNDFSNVSDLNETRNEVNGNVGSNGSAGVNPGAATSRKKLSVLGLSGADSLLIGNYRDNELLNKFAELSAKALSGTKIDVKIFKLDLDKFNLGFSHVLYAVKGDNGKGYYFSALLEATNRKPLNVHTVVESFNIKNSLDVLVTADAFDDGFFSVAEAVVSRGLGLDAKNIEFCEGVVIPYDANVETTADTIAKFAQDVIVSTYVKETNIEGDITIQAINELVGNNGMLELDLGFNTGSTINMLGRSIRSDFNVEVSVVKNNTIRSFNGQGGRKKLTTTSGYVEYLISEEVNPYTNSIKKVAEPMIILNEFVGSAPTINYALLSIINANTFTNRSTLKSLIIEKDAGPLNYLFNFGGEGNKYGEKISFKDSKSDPEIVTDIIREHIRPTPIFALEIEDYGDNYPYMVPFSALIDPASNFEANNAILKAASELLGQDIDAKDVMAGECSYIPLGEFIDNEGNKRDIREIDTTFIAKHINEPSIIIDWIYSNATPSICQGATGKHPYVLKLEVIDKVASMLNIEPVITGRAARIVLNADFVNELVGRAMNSGYNPRFDSPFISYNDYNNLQSIASAYANAAVNSNGFGVQTIRQGFMPMGNYQAFRR